MLFFRNSAGNSLRSHRFFWIRPPLETKKLRTPTAVQYEVRSFRGNAEREAGSPATSRHMLYCRRQPINATCKLRGRPTGHHTASFHPDDCSPVIPAIAGCIFLRLSDELLFPQSLDNLPLTPGSNSVVRSTGRSNHCITRQTHPASWCAGGRSRTVPPAHSFKPANVRTHVAANPSRCHVTCFRLTSFLIRLGILPDWSVVRQIARQYRQTQHRHKQQCPENDLSHISLIASRVKTVLMNFASCEERQASIASGFWAIWSELSTKPEPTFGNSWMNGDLMYTR